MVATSAGAVVDQAEVWRRRGAVRHVYVHVPFCHRICPYCAFYKHLPGDHDVGAYVAAVLAELDGHLGRVEVEARTVHLGGGTPTFLSRSHLGRLLEGLGERLGGGLQEFGVEANPRTFDLGKAQLMVAAGVGRASLGVQAWEPETLRVLGRDHGGDEAEEAYLILREAGVGSVSIDLMFAVPGQSLGEWGDALGRAVGLGPDHVSCYNLTYEEDTEFLRRLEEGEYRLDPDWDHGFFELAARELAAAGFEAYEISNYARQGHRSLHNSAYWRGADYLGVGPGAVSTVGGVRWKNVEDTRRYVAGVLAGEDVRVEVEELDDEAWALERLALELRTVEGVEARWVPTGREAALGYLVEGGLAELVDGRVRLSGAGRAVADEVVGYLVG